MCMCVHMVPLKCNYCTQVHESTASNFKNHKLKGHGTHPVYDYTSCEKWVEHLQMGRVPCSFNLITNFLLLTIYSCT